MFKSNMSVDGLALVSKETREDHLISETQSIANVCNPALESTVMCLLMMETKSEKCVIRWFCCCANIIVCNFTN